MSGYLRYPSIYRDDLYFTLSGNIWRKSGEYTCCLVTEFGYCRHICSNDKFVAFTSNVSGGSDVYLYDLNSQEVKRLTYKNFVSSVVCFYHDYVIFASMHESPFRINKLFYINVYDQTDIGCLPFGYGNFVSLPSASERFLVLSRNGYGFTQWKGYRGGCVGEILAKKIENEFLVNEKLSVNLKNVVDNCENDSFCLLEDKSRDFFNYSLGNPEKGVLIDQSVFFISEKDGTDCVNFDAMPGETYCVQQRNIFSVNLVDNKVIQHTFHDDFSVTEFSICPISKNLVYSCGGELFLLNSASSEINLVNLNCSNNNFSLPKMVDASKYLHDFSVKDDHEIVSIISRGRLFLMHPWLSGATQVHSTINYRFKIAKIFGNYVIAAIDDGSKDIIAIYKIIDPSAPCMIFDHDFGRIVDINPSRNGCYLAIANHRNELFLMKVLHEVSQKQDENDKKNDAEQSAELIHIFDKIDENGLKIGEVLNIDKSIGWMSDSSWSFNNEWIAYTYHVNDSISDIKFFSIKERNCITVVQNGFVNFAPRFCPSGKYMYFCSQSIFKPEWGEVKFSMFFQNSSKPYLLTLRDSVRSPFVLGEASVDEESNFAINMNGISNRIIPFPVDAGDFVDILPTNGKVMWVTKHDSENSEFVIQSYDFSSLKEEEIVTGVNHVELSQNCKWLIYSSSNNSKLRLMKAGDRPDSQESYKNHGWIDLAKINLKVDLKKEREFIFNEVVRLQNDFFWSENVARNLNKISVKYKQVMHKLSNRNDLNEIIKEFHGDLMCSHAYVISPGDADFSKRMHISLCAEFTFDKIEGDFFKILQEAGICEEFAYKIKKIYSGDSMNISPLLYSDIPLNVGDFLLSINGIKLTRDISPDHVLERSSPTVNVVALTKNGVKQLVINGSSSGNRFHIYREWVNNNRKFVSDFTNGKVGYIHIPDMSSRGYAEFCMSFARERLKDGIVIDVRFNEGGNISTLILEKLSQISLGYDFNRWSSNVINYPFESRRGEIVFLCNEQTGSDGDMFVMAIKEMKLGKVFGKRTWGGVVGIDTKFSLIDGGITSQPEHAFKMYSSKKIENVGVEPHEFVDISPINYAREFDPQIEAACKEIMKILSFSTKFDSF
ncbi:S41 family peptidase [Candidatus Gromoviella agglomerans]|uniref:S41 family peptidase n=1 Tax=Candidatus Gromoviella agglomerans TaxID=2806609 RepID=UPI001E358203|nr:S41 family peptidase [Candidatus Gromoviella agglomerans]UFX98471.1 S41 family peptidase [Candidatus Gromoviella agglomerans]